MGKRAYAGPMSAKPPIETYGLAGAEAPERPRCKGCGTPLVLAASVRARLCRVCKPHSGKREKFGKRADWRKKC